MKVINPETGEYMQNFTIQKGLKYGVSFGSALAMVISFTTNHSILWAIIHGLFSWIYVIYYALFKSVI